MLRSMIVLLCVVAAPVHAQSPFRVTHTYTVGGNGFWDYVIPDPPNHRLFIGRQDRLMVVDEDDGKLLGEVSGIDGAHGAALVPETGHGFATSGEDATVVMFDLKTLATLGRIPAGDDADAILYDPASQRVFSLNGDANTATVIEPRAGTAITNIALGGKPEAGASAADGRIFVNIVDGDEVVEIDANAAKIMRRWPTGPCHQPVAMAIDTVHKRLFSGCRNGLLAVSDYESGKVVATAPIGSGVDGAVFDAVTGNVLTSNGQGTLSVIHEDSPDSYRLEQTLATAPAARTMGWDPVSRRLFLVSAKFDPPAPGARRGALVAGSFMLIVVEATAAG